MNLTSDAPQAMGADRAYHMGDMQPEPGDKFSRIPS